MKKLSLKPAVSCANFDVDILNEQPLRTYDLHKKQLRLQNSSDAEQDFASEVNFLRYLRVVPC